MSRKKYADQKIESQISSISQNVRSELSFKLVPTCWRHVVDKANFYFHFLVLRFVLSFLIAVHKHSAANVNRSSPLPGCQQRCADFKNLHPQG